MRLFFPYVPRRNPAASENAPSTDPKIRLIHWGNLSLAWLGQVPAVLSHTIFDALQLPNHEVLARVDVHLQARHPVTPDLQRQELPGAFREQASTCVMLVALFCAYFVWF